MSNELSNKTRNCKSRVHSGSSDPMETNQNVDTAFEYMLTHI